MEVNATRAGMAIAKNLSNDFLKYISVDFSSLESRFEELFARMEALEAHINSSSCGTGSTNDSISSRNRDNGTTAKQCESDQISGNGTKNSKVGGPAADVAELAEAIESIRASQLRLKIDQELSQSTLHMSLEKLRREFERMPQRSDLESFRTEMDVVFATSVKTLHIEQKQMEHTLNVSLSEQQLAENKWKSVFEDTIGARIQDIWSAIHSTSRKLQESVQFLQIEIIKQEETSKEVISFVDETKKWTTMLDKLAQQHSITLEEQGSGMEQLLALVNQMSGKLVTYESNTAKLISNMTERLNDTDARLQAVQKTHETFAMDTDKILTSMCSDLGKCQSTLQTHQEILQTLSAGIAKQDADIMRIEEQLAKHDAKMGGLDGRVGLYEKKLINATTAIEENYQEMQNHVNTIQGAADLAAQDRMSMKRISDDLNFSLQETQHRLQGVSELATATEQTSSCTAVELQKAYALILTNSSNIAKNRQSIRDVSAAVDVEKDFAHKLQSELEKEVALSVSRFDDVAKRDDAMQQRFENAGNTTQDIKHVLEEAIKYNANMIHQLNTMVDSIAITESAVGMEDKMAKFALSCAELGLKLEHFGRDSPSSSFDVLYVKEDVKGELAVHLTKVIRFLGSGVSIDQNKYLLTMRRMQSVDPGTGAIVMEMPPEQVLENFRLAKATVFSRRMRMYMDQLEPVTITNKQTIEFRDNFERKVRFVLEFGLANLFPNVGKLKNPHSKRDPSLGTCIACNRPIDDDAAIEPQQLVDHHHSCLGHESSSSTFVDDAIADEHRLRRQKVLSAGSGNSGTSSFLSQHIDTKSTIKGRSGNSGLRPKSSQEVVHHPPGTVEYIYRAGFRIPKPQQQHIATPSKSISTSALLVTTSMPEDDYFNNGGELIKNDGSSLERVGLVGKNQNMEGVPTMRVHPQQLVRPHTAPSRAKSLPRLDPATTTATSPRA